MKLKLVVASMSALGLVCSPVFAATKHIHHHHHHHHRVVTVVTPAPMMQADYKQDYKDTLPPAAVCIIPHSTMLMDSMTQSMGRSMPSACNPGWFDRIQISGGLNLDAGKFGSRNANYQGENYQQISLNDAYINIAANIGDWTRAFASISYSDPTTASNIGGVIAPGFPPYGAQYSSPYNGLSTTNAGGTNFNLEQAYVTLGNFAVSPVYIQFGKQFQDFSRYEIHPITRSMTQVLSEALATSLKLGFIANGFTGSIYAFNNPIPQLAHNTTSTNYGASLGFDMPGDQFGFDLGIGYMYNLTGAQDVADAVNFYQSGNGFDGRAAGIAVYGDINAGPFTLDGRYTTAIQRFDATDLPENGIADTTAGVVNAGASGAEPWAASIEAGLGFDNWFYRNQTLYVGYQASGEAAAISLPKNRWLAGYNIDVVRNTNIGIEWDHDTAYSVADGGRGDSSNLVSLRAAIQFG